MTGTLRLRGRQAVLAVALSALLVTAGCTGFLDSGGDGGADGAQLDSVPNDAEFVGYVDASGMVGDDSLRSLANKAFETRAETSPYYDGPESVSEMLETMEEDSGLSPEKFNDVTFFGTSGDRVATNTEQAGMIVTSEFSEDEIVSSMEEKGTDFTEVTHQDTTVYSYGYENQNAIAALGDGDFALGDTAAVKKVIDVPQEEIPSEELGSGSPLDTSAFNTVQFISGSFSTSGDSVTANVNMVSESSDDASRTADLVDGALSIYSGVGNEEMRSTIEKLSVSQNGDTVTVSFTDSVENLEALIEAMYTMNTGSSASVSGSASAAATPVA